MIEPNGNYRMLEAASLGSAVDYLERNGPAGTILAVGTEDEIRELAHRVRLGAAEIEARRARRKAQRASRKANRH